MANSIYLVSCVGQKQPSPMAARDLYISPWFKKARSYAEGTGMPWVILSAKYGLVHPDRLLAPYELTLNDMPAKNRRMWADRVFVQLEQHLEGCDTVIFLAGSPYREYLAPMLRNCGIKVRIPMQGLRIGEQLQWLTEKR